MSTPYSQCGPHPGRGRLRGTSAVNSPPLYMNLFEFMMPSYHETKDRDWQPKQCKLREKHNAMWNPNPNFLSNWKVLSNRRVLSNQPSFNSSDYLSLCEFQLWIEAHGSNTYPIQISYYQQSLSVNSSFASGAMFRSPFLSRCVCSP